MSSIPFPTTVPTKAASLALRGYVLFTSFKEPLEEAHPSQLGTYNLFLDLCRDLRLVPDFRRDFDPEPAMVRIAEVYRLELGDWEPFKTKFLQTLRVLLPDGEFLGW